MNVWWLKVKVSLKVMSVELGDICCEFSADERKNTISISWVSWSKLFTRASGLIHTNWTRVSAMPINKILASLFAFIMSGSFLVVSLTSQAAPKTGEYHGQVTHVANQAQVWHVSQQTWISVEKFWQEWANNRDSKNWVSSTQYPIYEQVNERDTFLVKLDSGHCMMEFWHGRWRRANDVRRWDEKFNDYSACPYVFD